ncbi:MAG: cell division protein FtsW [Clostridia bacterium]|nr:cell division protein FtsW [Clostridia bacterium]
MHRIRGKKVSDVKKEPLSQGAAGRIDVEFLILCALLIIFGAVMNYSASSVYAEQLYGDKSYFLVRYIFFALLSVAATVPFVLFGTKEFWRRFARGIYMTAIGMLLLVLVIGTVGGGAQRWLKLGPITVQPSEVAKLAIVMMLARFLADNEKIVISKGKGNFVYGVLLPGCIIGAIGVLVALEKHISGLMIIGMIGVAVMLLGGTRLKWILLIAGVVVMAGSGLVLVSEYAQTRVNTWLHITEVDPLGEAWQTLQGLYAIGSGGIFGLGLFCSRQKFGYVSQPQNDFVFTIICEELGLMGAAAVILLFSLLIIRGFRIASHESDKFSALVVFGLVFKVAIQTILNIAVVTNSMPNTGISLPFFSSGGTSLALQIFEMGIILNLSRYSTMTKE